jgi:hypothetical protein
MLRSKQFFFAKKNQKTLNNWSLLVAKAGQELGSSIKKFFYSGDCVWHQRGPLPSPRVIKFFCFFLFTKRSAGVLHAR